MEDTVKAFFVNFIQNCKNSERLDSVQTSYFCKWAQSLIGEEITPIPADSAICGFRVEITETEDGVSGDTTIK